MRTWLSLLVLFAAAPLTRAQAAAPTGHVDAPNAGQPLLIGGWARDPDHAGPIPVHIYIDGQLAHAMLADGARPDLPFSDQDHGFTWVPPLLGPGTHQVIVYGIGVDGAGQPDGENPGLPGSPATIAQGCAGFAGAAVGWCQGVPNYYKNRAADTRYLYNDNLRVGVNASYGGTILELYGADHSANLITEHGGGAVQLSIWGYEPQGPDAFFADGAGVCAPQAFATEAACKAAGHASCRLWCCSQGAHVANCSTVKSCVDWGAGAPFNPIQAQAAGCGWDSPTNDVDQVSVSGPSVFTRKDAPYHFTKNTNMPGIVFEQTTTAEPSHVRLEYRIRYSGPYTLTPHPQEVPAVFPAAGMHHTYHYYDGPTPYQDPGAPVTTVVQPPDGLMLRVKNRAPYPHANVVNGTLAENWISACDASGARCLTLAFFSPQIKELNAAGFPGNGYGYLTPLAGFAIAPGMDERITVYLFPYRHDQAVAGKTVRRWIRELAAASQCLAHGFPCDDGDPCTADDRCQGDGSCAGLPGACGAVDGGPPAGDARPAADGEPGPAADGSGGARDGSGARADARAVDEAGLPWPGRDARPDATPGMEASGGCSCRAAASGGGAGAWLPLLALGLLVGGARCRRRRGRAADRGATSTAAGAPSQEGAAAGRVS